MREFLALKLRFLNSIDIPLNDGVLESLDRVLQTLLLHILLLDLVLQRLDQLLPCVPLHLAVCEILLENVKLAFEVNNLALLLVYLVMEIVDHLGVVQTHLVNGFALPNLLKLQLLVSLYVDLSHFGLLVYHLLL